MSPATTTFLRAVGVAVAVAVLVQLQDAVSLTNVIGANWAYVVAAVASSLLAALDHAKSPAGTVLFGTVGRQS